MDSLIGALAGAGTDAHLSNEEIGRRLHSGTMTGNDRQTAAEREFRGQQMEFEAIERAEERRRRAKKAKDDAEKKR